jgi:hypothetical protein
MSQEEKNKICFSTSQSLSLMGSHERDIKLPLMCINNKTSIVLDQMVLVFLFHEDGAHHVHVGTTENYTVGVHQESLHLIIYHQYNLHNKTKFTLLGIF